MSLTIHPAHAYALLTGLYIGKFTNIFSDVVITALVLYIVTPEIFTEDRLTRSKKWFWSWFRPQPVNINIKDVIQNLSNQEKVELLEYKNSASNFFDLSSLPKIELMSSPKANPVQYNK